MHSFADDPQAFTKEYAESLDARDPLRNLRDEFIIPTRNDLTRKTLTVPEGGMLKLSLNPL